MVLPDTRQVIDNLAKGATVVGIVIGSGTLCWGHFGIESRNNSLIDYWRLASLDILTL